MRTRTVLTRGNPRPIANPVRGHVGRYWLNGKPGDLDAKNKNKLYDVTLAKLERLLVKVCVANGMGMNYDKTWRSKWLMARTSRHTACDLRNENITWMTRVTGQQCRSRSFSANASTWARITDLLCINRGRQILWLQSNTPFDAMIR